MSDLERIPKSNSRFNTHRISIVVSSWLIIGLSLLTVITFVALRPPTGADAPSCRAIVMYPSYAKLTVFDSRHTKFASKYNLYLYREQGKDKMPDSYNSESILDGIPILFIPGNAGSYKQVRSIAAEASNIDFANKNNDNWQGRNLDFFAAHFNEDFTAFHGRTMLDQAEYLNDAARFILSLYSKSENPPTSVILLGHSMGGVVSRLMLTLPNYLEGSVNTILTLAAPHAAAPATFDGDILKIYKDIDRFWRTGTSSGSLTNDFATSRSRLQNVSLISITGGLLDSILPADYITLTGLVPDTHGFTVYTTGIPGVWTPIDHLAIVWCDQLRKVIAETILKIVDPHSPTRTYPLEERMVIFRKNLLSGFEGYAAQDFVTASSEVSIRLKLLKDSVITNEQTTAFTDANGKYHLFDIPDEITFEFDFLSSMRPEFFQEEASSLLACRDFSGPAGKKTIVDLSPESISEKFDFECVDLAEDIHAVPRSENGLSSISDSSLGGEHSPFFATKLNSSLLLSYKYIIFQEPQAADGEYFSILDHRQQRIHNLVIEESILKLLFGIVFELPSQRATVLDVTMKSAWSSLISFKLKVVTEDKQTPFRSFIRQYVEDPFETKWHINLEEEQSISFHGIAPFVPFKSKANPLHLQFWTPNSSKAKVEFQIDVLESLQLLILRYRLAAVSIPVFLIVLANLIQFSKYFETGIFISFGAALTSLGSRLPALITLTSILSPLLSNPLVAEILYLLNPATSVTPIRLENIHLNYNFLGLEEKFLWILGPIFLLMGFALITVLYLLLYGCSLLLPNTINLILRITSKLNSKIFGINNKLYKKSKQVHSKEVDNRRRFIGTVVLSVCVMFYIPYQFAYIVCCLIQAIASIRSITRNRTFLKDKDDILEKSNLTHFNLSILMLMIWLIPINIPILIVFFHNVAVRWETPFSSHHDIFAMLPIILVVGNNVQGKTIPRANTPTQKRITYIILIYFAFYSLIYGIRHLYWLHYIFNFFCAWIYLLHFQELTL